MDELTNFFRSKKSNHDRGIQKMLRRIDTHILALALVDIGENDREIFYTNMTKRAVGILENEIKLIMQEMKSDDADIGDKEIGDAKSLVASELHRWTNEKFDRPPLRSGNLPDVKLDSFGDLLNTFVKINDHCVKNGLFSVNGIENKSDNALFKKGFELIVDGVDPLLVEEIMENYIKSLTSKYVRDLSLIWNAIKLIQKGTTTFELVEKLKSMEFI